MLKTDSMKTIRIIMALGLLSGWILPVQAQTLPPAKVSIDSYEQLLTEVKPHRAKRLVGLDRFLQMSRKKGVVILDTRSDEMYRRKHVKGAIHLNFSDFTQESLAALIPDPQTTILIYCNNNIDGDPRTFASKVARPEMAGRQAKALTMALNIPTYINLYGYGYRNVYELSELVSIWDKRIEFEGADMQSLAPSQLRKK